MHPSPDRSALSRDADPLYNHALVRPSVPPLARLRFERPAAPFAASPR